MEDTKNKDDYALNTFKDIWKYDKARLLDLGNDFQVALSQKDEDRNEEARARSNFLKLVEDERRPFSHTMTDASRLLPEVISLLVGAGAKAAEKGISKLTGKAAKKATEDVAKKLVNENTSEGARRLFHRSVLLPRDSKDAAGKVWVRQLYENRDAMERLAGRKLSDDEVAAIRKNIDKFVPHRVEKYNSDVDEMGKLFKQLGAKRNSFKTSDDLTDFVNKAMDDGKLTKSQYYKMMDNVDCLKYYQTPSFSHLKVDRIMEPSKGLKDVKTFKEVFYDVRDVARPILSNTAIKAADSAINDGFKTKFEAYKPGELKMQYNYAGSEPTPVKDFVLGMLDLDFNDPGRFNEKDINAYMSFLEKKNIIEPGIANKWTPRQKVSFIREQLSDKDRNELYKKYWLESDQRKELLGDK